MKRYCRALIYILVLLMMSLLAGCSGATIDDDEDEESEYLTDNCMMGRNFSQDIPVYIYGRVIDSCSNETEDGYAVDKSAAEDAAQLYIDDCLAAGFKLIGTVTIEDNTFYTLTDEEYVMYIMDTPALDRMIITVERKDTQCGSDLTGTHTSSDSSVTLSQIGQDGGELYGMGYVVRLRDGRFLVFDGGYKDNSASERIYEEMASQTPEGEDIVIAAWILSHSHNDHCGAYVSFTEKHHTDVTLEKVFYNFGYEEQYTSTSQNYAYYDYVKSMTNTKLYPGMQRVNPHPGQSWDFGGLTITFISSGEVMTGDPMASANSMSLVWIMETDGQKFIFTADSNSENTPYVMKLYPGDTLVCDVLQVAHHGYNSGAMGPEYYEKIDPDFVLWPSGTGNYEKKAVQNLDTNRWILDNVDESRIYVARDEVQRFDLPMR